jgi:hypothetical protein
LHDRRSRLAKALGLLLAAVVALVAVGLLALHLSRQRALDEISARARLGQARNLSRVDALIRLAAAEDAPLPQRNRAIWALGEIGDRQALPALAALHRQEECDHSRLVCQREVRKAIRKIRGEMSLRHFAGRIWRRMRGLEIHPETRPP